MKKELYTCISDVVTSALINDPFLYVMWRTLYEPISLASNDAKLTDPVWIQRQTQLELSRLRTLRQQRIDYMKVWLDNQTSV